MIGSKVNEVLVLYSSMLVVLTCAAGSWIVASFLYHVTEVVSLNLLWKVTESVTGSLLVYSVLLGAWEEM